MGQRGLSQAVCIPLTKTTEKRAGQEKTSKLLAPPRYLELTAFMLALLFALWATVPPGVPAQLDLCCAIVVPTLVQTYGQGRIEISSHLSLPISNNAQIFTLDVKWPKDDKSEIYCENGRTPDHSVTERRKMTPLAARGWTFRRI